MLIVHNSALFDADVPHVGVATSGKGFNRLIEVLEFFLAATLSDIGETLRAIEFDSLSEIFERVVVVFFFQMEFSTIDQTVVVVFVDF